MKRMLITGGSGFLGSRAAKYFMDKYELWAPSHGEMDITDGASVDRAMERFRPDVVIHCAAMSDTGQCRREPEASWAKNVNGSVNVARAAGRVGAKCLLCSSDQVYFAVPENLYAREKRTAEQEGLAVNPDCVFLRLTWMYDPAPFEISGHRDFFSNVLPKLNTEETLSFAVFDKRGITDVYEVIRNLEKAMELPGGVYDFGSANEKNMYRTAVELFAGLGLDTGRIREDRDSFRESPRDMTRKPEALNSHGIFFSDTTEALIKHFAKYL